MNYLSKRGSENRLVLFIYFVIAFKITLSLFSSSHEPPCKSKSSLTFPSIESKLSQLDFMLFLIIAQRSEN